VRQREETEARKQAAAEAPAWQPGTKRKHPSEATNTDTQAAPTATPPTGRHVRHYGWTAMQETTSHPPSSNQPTH
jgi:hypothetical protein